MYYLIRSEGCKCVQSVLRNIAVFQGVDVKIPTVEYKPLDMYTLHKVGHYLYYLCKLSCIIYTQRVVLYNYCT